MPIDPRSSIKRSSRASNICAANSSASNRSLPLDMAKAASWDWLKMMRAADTAMRICVVLSMTIKSFS